MYIQKREREAALKSIHKKILKHGLGHTLEIFAEACYLLADGPTAERPEGVYSVGTCLDALARGREESS